LKKKHSELEGKEFGRLSRKAKGRGEAPGWRNPKVGDGVVRGRRAETWISEERGEMREEGTIFGEGSTNRERGNIA